MWYRFFKDYPPDTPQIHEPVQPGDGIIGCEMHEINGWGDELYENLPKLPPSPYPTKPQDNVS